MRYHDKLAQFKERISQIEYYKYTLNSLIYWDKLTYMPPSAISYRSKVMSFMADQQYRLMADGTFKEFVEYFDGNRNNDRITDAMIERIKRNARYAGLIPEDKYQEYIKLIAVSEQVWEQAKEAADFEAFRPYLEKIFHTFREFAEFWGYEDDPYDAMLGYYEEGMTVKRVDEMVSQLKPVLIDMLEKIRAQEAKDGGSKRLLLPEMGQERQEAVWKTLLIDMGFDFEAGRVDVGSHPTILASSPKDVRIVNAYQKEDLRAGIFNILHSGGKAIYQQSIDENLLGTFLAEVSSLAMEEAVGRLYENIMGRSKGFWARTLKNLEETAPELAGLNLEQVYRDVNTTQPGAVRLNADELTYLIHIIIRYELERDIIGGRLPVKDLPKVWNEKYKAYLGVEPENHSEGVLQDIHWAAGYVGYFPSYFVANVAAAQLAAAIERETGDLSQTLEKEGFGKINSWLKENIYRHGAVYHTGELIEKAFGEPLNSQYYLDYLRKKYSEVYKLDF